MTPPHPVVSKREWLAARTALLAKEKAFTRERDQLSAARRALPWVRIDKDYVFDGRTGKVRLADLFGPHSQLIVYHFMFGPDWEAGCKSCSFWADNFNSIIIHLNQRDVAMVAISRAPLARLDAFKRRMGWSFEWVSSRGNDFNRDFAVSFTADELHARGEQLQLRNPPFRRRGSPRSERVRQGCRRPGLPHLFLLRARSRHAQRRLSPPRPGAEGTRREGALLFHGVGSAA